MFSVPPVSEAVPPVVGDNKPIGASGSGIASDLNDSNFRSSW